MVIQNSSRVIIEKIGKEFGLSPAEAHRHYLLYMEEFVLKNLYEADFDILRIEGLGYISIGLLRTKAFLNSARRINPDDMETETKVSRMIQYMDELNSTLKKKKLYR